MKTMLATVMILFFAVACALPVAPATADLDEVDSKGPTTWSVPEGLAPCWASAEWVRSLPPEDQRLVVSAPSCSKDGTVCCDAERSWCPAGVPAWWIDTPDGPGAPFCYRYQRQPTT